MDGYHFDKKIEQILIRSVNNNDELKVPMMCYEIKYDYAVGISKIIKKAKLFDFSDSTMKELLNIIETTKTHLRNNNQTNENTFTKNMKLKIDFGKSLRLLSFQMVMSLFKVCKENHIQINGMKCGSTDCGNVINKSRIDDVSGLISNAVNLSAMKGNDSRLLLQSLVAFGVPYMYDILKYQSVFVSSKEMIYSLINNNFNVSIIDENDNESILFKLVRRFDTTIMKYVIKFLVNENKHQIYLNYFNHLHRSPLYYAIYNIIEKKFKRNNRQGRKNNNNTIVNGDTSDNISDKNQSEWMYDILTAKKMSM